MRIIILSLFALAACTKKPAGPVNPVEEGKRLYATHCTACHAANPKVDGAIGPANWGASLELLEAKVLRGDYPPGYTPKRPTKVMAVLPFLKDQIPNLHAYLNTP